MKLLISDYDRTFKIDDEGIKINKIKVNGFLNNDNIFAFATGRNLNSIKKVIKENGLEYNYIIANHGATIVNDKDEIIYSFLIDNAILDDLFNDISEYQINELLCFDEYSTKVDYKNGSLAKIEIKYTNEEDALNVLNKIKEKYKHIINSYYVNTNAIEIISSKTNKSYASRLLANELLIPSSDVYTIGDSFTDISMIKDFNGYCVKTAIPELLDICSNHVVASVGELIDKILLSDLYTKLNNYPFFQDLGEYEIIPIQDYGRQSKYKIKSKNEFFTLIMTEARILPYIEKIKVLSQPFMKMVGFKYLSSDNEILVLDYFGNDLGIDLVKIDNELTYDEVKFYGDKLKSIIDEIHSNKFAYQDFNHLYKTFGDYYFYEIEEKIKSFKDQNLIDEETNKKLIDKLTSSVKLLANRSETLIHADVTPLNVCINKHDKFLYLIDFDDVKIGDPLMDISRIINCSHLSKVFAYLKDNYYQEYLDDLNHLFYTLRVNINWYNHIKNKHQENIYNIDESLDDVLKVIKQILDK